MTTRTHRKSARLRSREFRNGNRVVADMGLIALSILVSIILAKTHVLTQALTSTAELELLGTFIAGMFFTSIFTTAPAIATLGEIALVQSVFVTAVIGALGSVAGDFLIFRFVKDRLSSDVIEVLRYEGVLKRLRAVFKLRFFRWFTFFLGGLVIASPLPDELGIALLGFSKMKTSWFFLLSFVFNFLGILGIGLAARALAGGI